MRNCIITSIAAILFFTASYAQQSNPFMSDANGRPLYMNVNYRIEGTPFVPENYQPADIVVASGKVYHNVRVKINLVENQVLYLDESKNEMITSLPVTRVVFLNTLDEDGTLHDRIFEGHPDIINKTGALIFEVIEPGRISLLKNIKATYRDEQKYSEAGITRTFTQTESYYALLPAGELKKIEKGKEFMLGLFADKKQQVEHYLSESGIKCKTAKDYINVFRFYRSL